MIQTGELVLLISPEGKRYLRPLDPAQAFHTQEGLLKMDEVALAGFGACVRTHKGHPYRILKPTLHDCIKGVKRLTTIMYPKEIGYVLLKLGAGPGRRIIEAGSGSGGLTTALAWMAGDTGRVYTCEKRAEFSKLARENLERNGLAQRVSFFTRDVSEEGFPEEAHGADALFLDVREPSDCLEHAARAVCPGAPVGFLLPTTNQISDLLRGLETSEFDDVEVLEIMLRRYKPVADRLRPEDRMVAHTGFLVFARHKGLPPEPWTPPAPPESDAAPGTPPDSGTESGPETGPGPAAGEHAAREASGDRADAGS
ncbi:tRNA (adenine(58)-N(1))-methyltransferase TrmI [Fundidesulfovibrio magnetotacticus]|uniref:tRNA (adenine(58)-N(1))-methyltransferase TrmI n=1 Tax=Fundidesulfovibrio magnetotacticus TaxID=2730080 RepID=A0A6V8LI63_9BACT|nr:tRNA (adenine-N1)-methyltransferase [Fundidesulfovibrio magnetotacticus]GFK92422.1 tRNA (adenine(58)-N(1))-methyltransferase TrmI [Fundidesulfovibrio magnetotacticus]